MSDSTTKLLTDEQIDKIRARTDAATPLPWSYDPRPDHGYHEAAVHHGGPADYGCLAKAWGGPEHGTANAAFIAAAREDIPALLADRSALVDLIRDLRAIAAEHVPCVDGSCTCSEAKVIRCADALLGGQGHPLRRCVARRWPTSDAKPLTPTEIGTAVGRAETLIASLARLGHILKRPGPAPNAEGIADAAAVISRVADEIDAFLPRLYATIDARDAEIARLGHLLDAAGRQPAPSALRWSRDPAASGPRSRTWVGQDELIVYDDGEWEVRPRGGTATAHGKADDHEQGMRRAVAVCVAMSEP